jgi:hypothetical protein
MELFTNIIVKFLFALSVVRFVFGTAFFPSSPGGSANAMLLRPVVVTAAQSMTATSTAKKIAVFLRLEH